MAITNNQQETAAQKSASDRFFALFTLLRAGEGRSVQIFCLSAFLMLLAYYILKTLREPLLLVHDRAELKSYAYAATAGLLFIIIPIYGFLARHIQKRQLTLWMIAFFITNLAVFYALGVSGFEVGFAYYVWVGAMSLMLTAQFWGYLADTYNIKSGQRLFPAIMLGATMGGIAGPIIAAVLYQHIGPWNLMLIAGLILAAMLTSLTRARSTVPENSSNVTALAEPEPHLLGGLALVLQDRYLLLLAALTVLLNWVNTTGEYILAEFVLNYADQLVTADSSVVKTELIANFYGKFYFIVNILTLAIQVLLVARIFRWMGVRGAVLVLPCIALISYGLIAIFPSFLITRLVKIAENSTDYSLMNTARHTLYLPLPDAHKFEGKTAVDTFFWRLGDLFQAGAIFAGITWLDFAPQDFAIMNMALAALWLWIARKLGVLYKDAAAGQSKNQPPILTRDLDSRYTPSGQAFQFSLPSDSFKDPDPGDVLRVSATLYDGAPLPGWMRFDPEILCFTGDVPIGFRDHTELLVTATDYDGLSVSAPLVLRHEC